MNASELVDRLLEHGRLVSLLATDASGTPAIYQILSPEAEVFPRLAVYEADRVDTLFADDTPLQQLVTFRVDLYARENILFPLNAALHDAMRSIGCRRMANVQDDYLPDMDIYVKSTTYEIDVQLPVPW